MHGVCVDSVADSAPPSESTRIGRSQSTCHAACVHHNDEARVIIPICRVQIEPPEKSATELLAEQQAAPTENGAASQEFQPQPSGSNNPFGQNASFGAPPGSFAQVRTVLSRSA